MIELPITTIRKELSAQVSRGLTQFIISAPPGSGKSTMVPQWLLEVSKLDNKVIYVLQPRRIATVLLAGYISELRGENVGEVVGYLIRHERKVSKNTRLCFVTEGVLMNRLLQGDLLEEVGAIIFDEFHERHLESDVSLSLALLLQKRYRPDLVLGVMSATIDVDSVKRLMPLSELFRSDGGLFSVKTGFQPIGPTQKLWEAVADTVVRNKDIFNEGTCLVFMPGIYEINNTINEILKRGHFTKEQVIPLHGSLSIVEQKSALNSKYPKVVVCTNVAETSLTIPGVRLVVDSGLAKVARYDALRGLDMLFTEPISKASADQRRGRAGRTQSGECIRLWSEFSHLQKSDYDTPEIHRKDIGSVVLQLIAAGLDIYNDIHWIDPPLKTSIDASINLLRSLGALNEKNRVTLIGERMALLGFTPRLSKLLVNASESGLEAFALMAIAIEQNDSILEDTDDPNKLHHRESFLNPCYSDLCHDINALIYLSQKDFSYSVSENLGIRLPNANRCWKTFKLLMQQKGSAESFIAPERQMSTIEESQFRRLIFNAYTDRLAIRQNLRTQICQMFGKKSGYLVPKAWSKEITHLVSIQLEEEKRSTGKRIAIKRYSKIEEDWLNDLSGVSERYESVIWNGRKQRVITILEIILDGLLLVREENDEVIDDEKAVDAIRKAIENGELDFNGWTEASLRFIRRVNFCAKNCPEYEIPVIDDEARDFILNQSLIGTRSSKDLNQVDILPIVKDYLNPLHLSAIDSLAPEEFQLPGRKRPSPLRYTDDGECILSEVIQALYDCPLPVTVAGGKYAVLFELLSPARRPVQITRDLDQFWKGSYFEVKKELKGRYPKHEWR